MSTFTALASLVREHDVLPEAADAYGDAVEAHAVELDALLPDVEAANARLHELVPDRHLALRREGTAAPPPRARSGGFARVEQLDARTDLVAVRPYFTAPDDARAHLAAVARLVTGERLLLDLRACGGGDTETAALVHGWLLGPEPRRLGRFEHRGRPSEPYVSDPSLGHHVTGDVRVLTSARTFSGGEDLAYVLQALGRARVVGERTAGGAHPVEHFPLPGGRTCQVPVARSVIEATGGNWEGTGVVPDVACAAADALDVALADLPGASR